MFPEKYLELEGGKYELSFYDDFSGNELDTTKWSLCPQQRRQDAGGWWDDSMIEVRDGKLVVKSDVSKVTNMPISGGIRTRGKFEQAGGYFEIRCTLQKAHGHWGAFWLMCDEQCFANNGPMDGTAKDGAEFDIFESCHLDLKKICQNIHFDGYGVGHKQIPNVMLDTHVYDGNYHTFSLLWTKDAYIFFIDGKETYRLQEGDENYPGYCEPKTYLKISDEFGTWAGDYYPEELPDEWYVDYVRVYKLCEE
ncbi:MAG: glycoside hydrolase family 16 protein [Oscillospiraceae bacterium]|nr:glycoside hydrolase family 16 protein [Oscillospiraceae bacterium]